MTPPASRRRTGLPDACKRLINLLNLWKRFLVSLWRVFRRRSWNAGKWRRKCGKKKNLSIDGVWKQRWIADDSNTDDLLLSVMDGEKITTRQQAEIGSNCPLWGNLHGGVLLSCWVRFLRPRHRTWRLFTYWNMCCVHNGGSCEKTYQKGIFALFPLWNWYMCSKRQHEAGKMRAMEAWEFETF